MLAQELQFSGMRFGLKGDNAPQIIKNLAWVISQDTQLSVTQIHDQLDHIVKDTMVGIGEGVGIFDWVSDDIAHPYILCTLLETPVQFPATDEKAIDIVLTLVSPEKNGPLHLQYLSRLTRMFREPKLLQSLRSVGSVDGMIAVLSPDNRKLAAA